MEFSEINGQLLPGDTLDGSLRRQKVPCGIRGQIINSLSGELDFRRLKPSDCYTIQIDQEGRLHSFTYESGPLEIYTISKAGPEEGYTAKKEAVELKRHTVIIHGVIHSSLFASFAKKNENMRLVYNFADIFSSKIDFNTETRKGDRYFLVFDKFYKGDELVAYGKIQAARYISTNGGSFEGYYYSSDQIIGSYFDQNGQGVGTYFIRSPVPMGRVSSKFSYRRKHPITGVIKPHLGIDLAAPVGTPIMAAADGQIISIGRNKGNGKQIIISHNSGYKTYYGHLSRFGKGLRKGSMVRMKEVIGYVGSSGTATGPHLDYRIQHNGKFKNPFSIEFKPKSILKGEELARFKRQTVKLEQLAGHVTTPSPTPLVLKISDLVLSEDEEIILL